MAGEWRETTLGEVTDFLSGGTPSKGRPDYWVGSVPWVSAKDMKRFRLDDTEDHVSEDGVSNGTKLVPAGSVLLLARGMTLLNDLPICVISRPMTFNQDVKALRPKPPVRSDYLPYLLLGNKDRLLSLVDLAGHGTGRLNSDELKALDVTLPPLSEQRAIAHILGTLDDKIELNRRMNETLEAMARALFKSWFVDFAPVRAKAEGRDPGLPKPLADLFPARLVDSKLGEIPEGWEVARFADTVEIVGGGTPKTSVEEFWEGDIPWFSVVDAPAGSEVWVIDTEKKVTRAGVENSSTRVLPVGTTIISARGTVGRIALVGVPMAMNQSCYGLRGRTGTHGFFNYFSTRELVARLQQHAHGSVFDTITRDTLARYLGGGATG
ncbi:MAG: restriction endonuclease subunit S [Candidatus Eisenbacteria bacterium]|nr:restriction endonuclease subunit S [Candidatus Eisenbacteria bacterium]